jgi:hypothetical protein
VHSLTQLEEQQGPYDAVVVAAGAAAATLREVGQLSCCCVRQHAAWLVIK